MSHPAMEALPGTSSSSSPLSVPSILSLHVLKYTELLPFWVLAPAFFAWKPLPFRLPEVSGPHLRSGLHPDVMVQRHHA